jgi:succinate-acetate transporter protein
LAGLGIASLVRSGFSLHWVGADQAAETGLILIAVPWVLQLIACVFAYLARDGAGGTTFGVLATTWLAFGLSDLIGGGRASGALGLLLLAAAATLILSSLAVSAGKPLPALAVALSAVRFGFDGVHQLGGGATWQNVAGIIGLVVCGVAAYCVLAFSFEDARRRRVLPTFRRTTGAATYGDPISPDDALLSDAGIRPTS